MDWKNKVKVLVTQACLTVCNTTNCSLPGSSCPWNSPAKILQWVAIPFSRGSSWPRYQPRSPALQADSLPSESPGSPKHGFSHLVLSDSLWPHRLQHTRLPCPSPTPGACTNSYPLSQWWHPTISSSIVSSTCHQSFPASQSFPRSQFYESGGQSIGVSASASVIPMNIQDWFPLGLTGWISLQSKGLSRVLSNTTVQKYVDREAQM